MQPVELAYAGIARQAQLIAAGEVSSRELVETYRRLTTAEALAYVAGGFRRSAGQ